MLALLHKSADVRNRRLCQAPLTSRQEFDSSRIMETDVAVAALSALAHKSRLQAFRLIVRAGPEGIPAGEIAAQLGVAPPTLSFHLAHLARAGLVDSHREGRSVLYALRVDGIRDLLGFITQDCCQGRPELCPPEGEAAQGCEAGNSRRS